MKRCLRCDAEFTSDSWRCPSCQNEPIPGVFLDFTSPDADVDYVTEGYDNAQWQAFEEANSFWFRPRARLIGSLIESQAGVPGSLLEVGCGAGGVLQALHRRFPSTVLVGGEPSTGGLAIAARRVPSAELLVLDANDLPFRDEFDVVGAFDVVEHIADDRGAIRELASAVRPGGILILTVPQHPCLWSRYDEAGGHHRRYTRSQLLTLLREAGLRVERATSFVAALLPVVALTRVRANRTDDYDVLASESRRPPGARILERILSAEVRATEMGLTLPAGTSLAVVARRL